MFAAAGHFGTSAITSLTIQSTLGVRASYPVDPRQLSETLACLSHDLPPAGIKIGMLASSAHIDAIAEFISTSKEQGTAPPIVLDPVLRSSSGHELLDAAGLAQLKHRLLPLVDWITPNLAELAQLADRPASTPAEIETAVHVLQERLPNLAIAATGGHLDSADDLIAAPGQPMHWLRGPKIVSQATHGTGCAFASALLCALVHGADSLAAAVYAKHFVTHAILHAEPIGHGRGPMNLVWPLRNPSAPTP